MIKLQAPFSVPVMVETGIHPMWIAFFSSLQQVGTNGTLSGTTAQRPTSATPNRWIGMPYFDTTLGIPIWLSAVNTDVWIDATGAPV